MKKFLKFNTYSIVFFMIIILFFLSIIGYYVTINDLEKKLENTPYSSHGSDWPIKQKKLNLALLAESDEIENNNLVKLSQEIVFFDVDTSNLKAKCSGASIVWCSNCEKGTDKECLKVKFKQNNSLSLGEIRVKEYTKVIYHFTDEITDIYFPKTNLKIINNILTIEFNDLNRNYINNKSVAYLPKAKILSLFQKNVIEWTDYTLQSVDKFFIVQYK